MSQEKIDEIRRVLINRELIKNTPLDLDELKGKIELKWFGHAGFKVHFKDEKGVDRAIYIDYWANNRHTPEEDKWKLYNDADLILVSCGQLEHSMHGHYLWVSSKKAGRKMIVNSEYKAFGMCLKNMLEETFHSM